MRKSYDTARLAPDGGHIGCLNICDKHTPLLPLRLMNLTTPERSFAVSAHEISLWRFACVKCPSASVGVSKIRLCQLVELYTLTGLWSKFAFRLQEL